MLQTRVLRLQELLMFRAPNFCRIKRKKEKQFIHSYIPKSMLNFTVACWIFSCISKPTVLMQINENADSEKEIHNELVILCKLKNLN